MTGELYDDRQPGWYYIDNALHDEYGPKIGALGIAVYATLARHANRARVSWPSYSKIAASLALSRPTVIATVRVLVEHGLVRVETIKEDGRRPYNRYTLVKLLSHDIGKGDLPVKDVDQCTTGKAGLLVKDVSSTGKAGLPLLVKDVYWNKTQLTRPKEQDPKRERAQAHTRGTGAHQARAPTQLKTIEEMLPFKLPEAEWDELRSHGIADKWAVAHVDIFIANYENTGTERSAEEWYSKCRKWLLQDWDKAQTTGNRR